MFQFRGNLRTCLAEDPNYKRTAIPAATLASEPTNINEYQAFFQLIFKTMPSLMDQSERTFSQVRAFHHSTLVQSKARTWTAIG